MLKDWNSLPQNMQQEEVKKYYTALTQKRLAKSDPRFCVSAV